MRWMQWISIKELSFLLLPTFFLLHEWNARFIVFRFSDVLSLLWQYILIGLLFYILIRVLFKNRVKAFWITLVTAVTYLFFGTLQDALKGISEPLSYSMYLIPAILIIYIGLVVMIFKRSKSLKGIGFFILLMSIYIGMDVFELGRNFYGGRDNESYVVPAISKKPDVYLMVMDEYTSSSALSKYWQYDNSSFDTFLLSNNFQLMPDSKSNYNYTIFSISSMFRMNFLDHQVDTIGATQYYKSFKLVYNSFIPAFFDELGYDIYNYSSFNLKGYPFLMGHNFWQFGYRAIHQQTLGGRMVQLIDSTMQKPEWDNDDFYELHSSNNEKLRVVEQLAANESGKPKFVYLHVFAPHPPFFVDRLGNLKPRKDVFLESKRMEPDAYTSYLSYYNHQVMGFISNLLKVTKEEAIIILMGDHGFRNKAIESVNMEHQFMNLLAVHLPGSSDIQMPQVKSLVNLFPALLNTSFGMQIPFRKDSSTFTFIRNENN